MEYVNHLAAGGYAFIPGGYYQTLSDVNYDNKDIFLSELEHLFESDAQASQLDHEKFEDNVDLDESGLERKPPEHYQKDRIDVTRETEEKRNNLN